MLIRLLVFCLIICTICPNCNGLAKKKESESKSNKQIIVQQLIHFYLRLAKLYKMLNWLAAEKNDKDMELLFSQAERIDKFVKFVFLHKNDCKFKINNEISCLELRKKIDRHKKLAGTEGINFDSKFTSFASKISRFFNTRQSDVATCYGVNSIICWLLEINSDGNIGSMSYLDVPVEIDKAIIYVIKHKDKLWKIIRDSRGEKSSFWSSRSEPKIDKMVKWLNENALKMGFIYSDKHKMQSLVKILQKEYNLFSTKPPGLTRYF